MQEILNFISPEECKEIINLIDANHTRSSVVVGGTDRQDVTDHRTSSTSNLDSSNFIVKSIHKRISQHLNLPLENGEALQGQLYEVGQYFKPHNDFFTGPAYDMHCKASGNRTHTLMIYLNDDYKGGETNFPNLNKKVSAVTGKALWWTNMKDNQVLPETLHEGVPVTEGKKYIVTSWWREKKWDGAGDAKLYEDEKNKKIEEAPINESKIIKVNENISLEETSKIPKLTSNGFKLIKCPDKAWSLIKESYELLKQKEIEENFEDKENWIPGESTIMDFGWLPTIKSIIHQELKPVHEEFCNHKLIPNYIYGIRSYKKGATLKEHTDRIDTHHISSIIIVDKDLTCGCQNKKYADDWPLDIKGHDGEWYKVYAKPGDMILYESAICEHGRKEPFAGEFFRNFYVHYQLEGY
jgi:prolyl 4-hydroxylase|tara:strand:- start:3451 stop:4683 length:1233 start_codon:yes stop_codon:yes gene_type:complete